MSFLQGRTPAACQESWPAIVMIGTSYDFSDTLLRLLRLSFEGVRFDREPDILGLPSWERIPRVVIVHETAGNLAETVEFLRHELRETLIAIGCSNPDIVNEFNGTDKEIPVSALQMDAQVDVWFSVLHLLLSGHPYVPVKNGRHASVRNTPVSPPPAPDDLEPTPIESAHLEKLTPREQEILPLIAKGAQNKVIADRLGLSDHTVKLHTHHILRKLGVKNRTGAANWYLSHAKAEAHGKTP